MKLSVNGDALAFCSAQAAPRQQLEVGQLELAQRDLVIHSDHSWCVARRSVARFDADGRRGTHERHHSLLRSGSR